MLTYMYVLFTKKVSKGYFCLINGAGKTKNLNCGQSHNIHYYSFKIFPRF